MRGRLHDMRGRSHDMQSHTVLTMPAMPHPVPPHITMFPDLSTTHLIFRVHAACFARESIFADNTALQCVKIQFGILGVLRSHPERMCVGVASTTIAMVTMAATNLLCVADYAKAKF